MSKTWKTTDENGEKYTAFYRDGQWIEAVYNKNTHSVFYGGNSYPIMAKKNNVDGRDYYIVAVIDGRPYPLKG